MTFTCEADCASCTGGESGAAAVGLNEVAVIGVETAGGAGESKSKETTGGEAQQRTEDHGGTRSRQLAALTAHKITAAAAGAREIFRAALFLVWRGLPGSFRLKDL